MLCYVMLCYVMLCYVMLCYVMLCYIILYYIHYIILYYIILYYIILYYIIYLQYFDIKTLQHLINFPFETEKFEALLVTNNWSKEAKLERDRQCTCNITLKRILSSNQCNLEKSNKCYTFQVCMCSLRYPVCPALPYFSTLPYKLKISKKKKLLKTKCLLWFFLLRLSHSKMKWARRYHKCT
jgi:hypothetical protein